MSTQKQNGSFDRRLFEIRKSQGLSIAEFAERLGISRQAAEFLEAGAVKPDDVILAKVANAFQVDINQLLTGKPSPAIAAELESLQVLKHNFRLLQNEVRTRLNVLQNVDRDLRAAVKVLQSTLKFYQKKKGQEHDNEEKKPQG